MKTYKIKRSLYYKGIEKRIDLKQRSLQKLIQIFPSVSIRSHDIET